METIDNLSVVYVLLRSDNSVHLCRIGVYRGELYDYGKLHARDDTNGDNPNVWMSMDILEDAALMPDPKYNEIGKWSCGCH